MAKVQNILFDADVPMSITLTLNYTYIWPNVFLEDVPMC